MCGRYKLPTLWWEFSFLKIKLIFPAQEFAGADDARPTDPLPIIRVDDQGDLIAEMRRWGFLRMVPGARGNLLKKAIFNARGEEAAKKTTFRGAFKSARCLVPMEAWYEWPTIEGRKTQVAITKKDHPLIFAAGLYENSIDPLSGELVPTFTIVTAPPPDTLADVHDRSPLILADEDFDAWLEGDVALARALVGALPEDAFVVVPTDNLLRKSLSSSR